MIFWLFLAVVGGLGWVMSAYDPALTGEDMRRDHTRRGLRCGLTLILAAVGYGGVVHGAALVLFPIAIPATLIWYGCLAEFGATAFHGLLDSADHRELNAEELSRDLDRLAALAKAGRNEAAIELSARLKASGEVSPLAMESLHFQIYRDIFESEGGLGPPSLAPAGLLRGQRRYAEAESLLVPLVEKEPNNVAAILLLIRVRGKDLARPGDAMKPLNMLESVPDMPRTFVEFVKRTLNEWSGMTAPRQKAEGIESMLVAPAHRTELVPDATSDNASIDELLAAGRLATAIELIEARIASKPGDFELWLKLAEAKSVFCGDMTGARKIVDRMARNSAFSADQIQVAKAKLAEWGRAG
jgi:hypothetical protein